MRTARLEAFSDGVLAIIITIMVLELKVPHGHELADLRPLLPKFGSYALSFVFIGIYWGNHHHMLHAASRVNGAILWSNLHLLFWLSLVPVVTEWMGETGYAQMPVAVYGLVMLLSGIAYYILARALIHEHGPESPIATAIGADAKGRLSVLMYAIAIGLSFVQAWIAVATYVIVAIMWLVPDRRIERVTAHSRADG
jgi:uncharacterized membrane protein